MNKTNIDAHVGRSHFFQQAVHSIRYSNMGCGVSSPLMTKLKRYENLTNLIWASKVSYAKGLRDA
jgi:hypothetical protein